MLAVLAFSVMQSAQSQDYGIYGSWRIDDIVYTFEKDSLYIDDDVEGFAYLFHRDMNDLYKVTYDSNVNGITGTIRILYMDRVKMIVRFISGDNESDDVMAVLFRVPDYNFHLHFAKEASGQIASQSSQEEVKNVR